MLKSCKCFEIEVTASSFNPTNIPNSLKDKISVNVRRSSTKALQKLQIQTSRSTLSEYLFLKAYTAKTHL